MAELRTFVAGNAVVLFARVYNGEVLGVVPMDPGTSITIQVRRADQTLAVDGAAMTKIEVGLYRRTLQLANPDVLGLWHAKVKTVHQGLNNETDWTPVFVVKA